MPSIVASYIYTFVALIAVSSLLVFSFMDYADAIRFSSELKQLKNLMNHVVAKGTELLTLTISTNASVDAFIQMPASIGNKQYWLLLHNDSARTWMEGGLGNIPVEETDLRAYLPGKASATGYYTGGHGAAHLESNLSSGVLQIQLTSSSEDV